MVSDPGTRVAHPSEVALGAIAAELDDLLASLAEARVRDLLAAVRPDRR